MHTINVSFDQNAGARKVVAKSTTVAEYSCSVEPCSVGHSCRFESDSKFCTPCESNAASGAFSPL